MNVNYDDKARAERPPEAEPVPWDTNVHGAPDPAWPIDEQLTWFSRYSHVLLLYSSERLRTSAAGEADAAVVRARTRRAASSGKRKGT